jgi:hypothetical protein
MMILKELRCKPTADLFFQFDLENGKIRKDYRDIFDIYKDDRTHNYIYEIILPIYRLRWEADMLHKEVVTGIPRGFYISK